MLARLGEPESTTPIGQSSPAGEPSGVAVESKQQASAESANGSRGLEPAGRHSSDATGTAGCERQARPGWHDESASSPEVAQMARQALSVVRSSADERDGRDRLGEPGAVAGRSQADGQRRPGDKDSLGGGQASLNGGACGPQWPAAESSALAASSTSLAAQADSEQVEDGGDSSSEKCARSCSAPQATGAAAELRRSDVGGACKRMKADESHFRAACEGRASLPADTAPADIAGSAPVSVSGAASSSSTTGSSALAADMSDARRTVAADCQAGDHECERAEERAGRTITGCATKLHSSLLLSEQQQPRQLQLQLQQQQVNSSNGNKSDRKGRSMSNGFARSRSKSNRYTGDSDTTTGSSNTNTSGSGPVGRNRNNSDISLSLIVLPSSSPPMPTPLASTKVPSESKAASFALVVAQNNNNNSLMQTRSNRTDNGTSNHNKSNQSQALPERPQVQSQRLQPTMDDKLSKSNVLVGNQERNNGHNNILSGAKLSNPARSTCENSLSSNTTTNDKNSSSESTSICQTKESLEPIVIIDDKDLKASLNLNINNNNINNSDNRSNYVNGLISATGSSNLPAKKESIQVYSGTNDNIEDTKNCKNDKGNNISKSIIVDNVSDNSNSNCNSKISDNISCNQQSSSHNGIDQNKIDPQQTSATSTTITTSNTMINDPISGPYRTENMNVNEQDRQKQQVPSQPPANNRSILILREIDPNTPEESVKDIFNSENCPSKPVHCEYALHNSWYVTFKDDEDAKVALAYIRRYIITWNGQPIMARYKPKPAAPSASSQPPPNIVPPLVIQSSQDSNSELTSTSTAANSSKSELGSSPVIMTSTTAAAPPTLAASSPGATTLLPYHHYQHHQPNHSMMHMGSIMPHTHNPHHHHNQHPHHHHQHPVPDTHNYGYSAVAYYGQHGPVLTPWHYSNAPQYDLSEVFIFNGLTPYPVNVKGGNNKKGLLNSSGGGILGAALLGGELAYATPPHHHAHRHNHNHHHHHHQSQSHHIHQNNNVHGNHHHHNPQMFAGSSSNSSKGGHPSHKRNSNHKK